MEQSHTLFFKFPVLQITQVRLSTTAYSVYLYLLIMSWDPFLLKERKEVSNGKTCLFRVLRRGEYNDNETLKWISWICGNHFLVTRNGISFYTSGVKNFLACWWLVRLHERVPKDELGTIRDALKEVGTPVRGSIPSTLCSRFIISFAKNIANLIATTFRVARKGDSSSIVSWL